MFGRACLLACLLWLWMWLWYLMGSARTMLWRSEGFISGRFWLDLAWLDWHTAVKWLIDTINWLKACLLNLYASLDLYVDCDRLYLDGRACNPLTEIMNHSTVTNYEASKKYFERRARLPVWWTALSDYYQWVCYIGRCLVLLQNGQSTCLVACIYLGEILLDDFLSWDSTARQKRMQLEYLPMLPTFR